jgi:hypothetical protein
MDIQQQTLNGHMILLGLCGFALFIGGVCEVARWVTNVVKKATTRR